MDLDQLRGLGLSASSVRDRVGTGRLHRLYRGVYAVGHPIVSQKGRWMAAVRACGPGAVLSHRDAAALLDLRRNARARFEVTVPRRSRRSRPGIQIHRPRHLHPDDVTVIDEIPCTTVARTLIDLAEVVGSAEVERAIERAEKLQIFDLRAVQACINRAPSRRGARLVTSLLALYRPESAFTRSDLEKAFLAICDAAGIPRPSVNTWVEYDGTGGEIDFVWPDAKVAIEVDGWEDHGNRFAFERDRERDRRLRLDGWRVERFTWRQLFFDPEEVERTLRALLPGQAASSATTSLTPSV
jgi:hypothetical protein